MSAIYYPPADRTAQWFADEYPGVDMGGVEKVLLHTTEGGNWPSYDGGAKAPQLTYHATAHRWHQHFPLNRSARALQDPTGTPVRENRDRVVQVEIIASADRAYARKHGLLYVEELDEQAIDDLGTFVGWMHREFGVPLVKAALWLPYPKSYGNSDARMTSAEYDAFRGVLGHQHASGNSHGDPGAIPINQIMAVASASAGVGEDDYMATPAGQAQLNRIEQAVAKLAAAEAARYADLANRVQAGNDEERGRYKYYSDQFGAIRQELADDPASPVQA
jgi:hypothetical protein